MEFEQELNAVLPGDLPNRETVIAQGAEHLRLIVEANALMNLTRIVSPREAAVKHVLDSVIPWRLFEESDRVLDAGTGAGFPGIPLAITMPALHFTLCESTGKKARFVESTVAALGLKNASVSTTRAEGLCQLTHFDIITARAFAPLSRTLEFFGPALRKGSKVLLYKGPDVEQEIKDASDQVRRCRLAVRVASRYDLPEGLGRRTIVEVTLA